MRVETDVYARVFVFVSVYVPIENQGRYKCPVVSLA